MQRHEQTLHRIVGVFDKLKKRVAGREPSRISQCEIVNTNSKRGDQSQPQMPDTRWFASLGLDVGDHLRPVVIDIDEPRDKKKQ